MALVTRRMRTARVNEAVHQRGLRRAGSHGKREGSSLKIGLQMLVSRMALGRDRGERGCCQRSVVSDDNSSLG